MNSYDDGDIVDVDGEFRNNSTGALTDPANVFVRYRFGSGEIVEKEYGVHPEVTKTSTGLYQCSIDTTGHEGKICRYRFYSTGTGQAAEEGQFAVRSSRLVP